MALSTACSSSHILHTQKQVNRVYTYVDFARSSDPFEMKDSVGGDHISAVKILGFQGDKFLIEFTNVNGQVNYDIAGTGSEYPTESSKLAVPLDPAEFQPAAGAPPSPAQRRPPARP